MVIGVEVEVVVELVEGVGIDGLSRKAAPENEMIEVDVVDRVDEVGATEGVGGTLGEDGVVVEESPPKTSPIRLVNLSRGPDPGVAD